VQSSTTTRMRKRRPSMNCISRNSIGQLVPG
jgi:hypothetical protein